MLFGRLLVAVLLALACWTSSSRAQLTMSFVLREPLDVPRKPRDIAVADFNNDGIDDVALTSSGSNKLSILVVNEDGSFEQATSLAIGKSLRGLAVGDFNQDGNADVVLATASRNTFVALGKGDGTVAGTRTVRRCCRGFGVTVADVDNTNGDDLILANPTRDDISLLLNKGGGKASFDVEKRFRAGRRPEQVATADFDGDGSPDVAALNTRGGGSDVAVYLGDENGTLRRVANFVAGRRARALALGDMSGNGVADILVAAPRSNELSVLLNKNDGAGGFNSAVVSVVTCNPDNAEVRDCRLRHIATADFDQDGKVDVVAGLSFPESVTTAIGAAKVDVLKGFEDATFGTPVRTAGVGRGIPIVAVGNFNRDSFPDIVVATRRDSNMRLIINTTFGLPTPGPGTPGTGSPRPTRSPTPAGNGPGASCDPANGDGDCAFPLFCSPVDATGICCDTPCDGVGERCDLPGTEGTCLPTGLAIGDPCTSDLQCQSGFCTDGFCCDRRCLGADEVCSRPGEEGICGFGTRTTPTSSVPPPPTATPTVGKKDLGEPCVSPAECLSGFCPPEDLLCCDEACAGLDESCALRDLEGICFPLGSGQPGETCTSAADCGTGFCPPDDFICCDSACDGPNDVCDASGHCIFGAQLSPTRTPTRTPSPSPEPGIEIQTVRGSGCSMAQANAGDSVLVLLTLLPLWWWLRSRRQGYPGGRRSVLRDTCPSGSFLRTSGSEESPRHSSWR